MTSRKIKAFVHVNDNPSGNDLNLDVTSDQAALLLEKVLTGEAVFINLVAHQPNGHTSEQYTALGEDPKAYAQ